MTVLTLLAVGSGTGLAVGLAAPDRPRTVDPTRSLTVPEARRLASMRVTNYRDGRTGVRASVGRPGGQTRLAGWVDWSRGLSYLRATGPGAGPDAGLLQAVPGVVAHHADVPTGGTSPVGPASERPDTAASAALPAPPPAAPPRDGWRVRPLDPDGRRVDALVALLFGVAADRPDPVEPLTRGPARWLGRGHIGDVDVDILLAPAPAAAPTGSAYRSAPPTSVPPSTVAPASVAPASVAPASVTAVSAPPASVPAASGQLGGPVRYWLDDDARLYRLEARLPGDVPVDIDLDRETPAELDAVPALGGRPVRPRAVTDAEAARLASMPTADQARGGATVTLTLPTLPAANLRGVGLLDWRDRVAYLSIRDLDGAAGGTLVRADRDGIATRAAPAGGPAGRDPGGVPAMPPVPPPTDRGWSYADWRHRSGADGAADLDLMLSEALSMSSGGGSAGRLRSAAVWLRSDSVAGRPVAVFEIPKAAEAGVPAGRARFRYWVDDAGLLRRLELRTRAGAYAQLDLSPGRVSRIAAVPID